MNYKESSARNAPSSAAASPSVAPSDKGFESVALLVAQLLDGVTISPPSSAMPNTPPPGLAPPSSPVAVPSAAAFNEIAPEPVHRAAPPPAALSVPMPTLDPPWLRDASAGRPSPAPQSPLSASGSPSWASSVADRTSPPARVEQSPKPSENGFAEPATPQVAHFAEASRPEANMQAAEEKPVVAPVVAALATASKQVEPSAPTLPSLVTADDKPALESNAAAEPFQQDGHAINIKGRGEGVTIEIGKGNWEVLVAALEQRLERSGNFFRGASVALDIGDRLLQEGQLRMVCDTLIAHGMKPGIVRTSSDRTFQTALTLSLASTLENKEGAPVESGQGAVSNVEAVQHFVYRGALRSGQVLKRRAHILIVGDVNPGAEVVASGDILVWGRLRGSAHAGADGDVRCVVAAFDIDPVQLRIADAIAVGNAGQNESGYRWPWRHEVDKRPEIARLINGQIIVEPWDEAKVAGSPILKRRR